MVVAPWNLRPVDSSKMSTTGQLVLKNKNKSSRKGNRKGMPKVDGNRRAVEQYAGDAYSLAQRTMRGLNELRKLINIEEKYSDVNTSVNPDYSGTMTALTQLAQGTTMTTRVGNSIRVQRFEMWGRVSVNTAVTTYSLCRIMVVRDMEGQGTAPTVADVLEAVGTADAPRQPYDWLNRKRFSILYDDLVPLTPLSGGGVVKVFHYAVNLEKHVLYRGTTAAASSDGEGSIYLVCVSDEPTNTPSVRVVSRITYTDD